MNVNSRKILYKTLAKNDCDVITITEKGDFKTMLAKKAVIIFTRVHLGEVKEFWIILGMFCPYRYEK
jgi:hypothetical protein